MIASHCHGHDKEQRMTGAYVAYGWPGLQRTLAWRVAVVRRVKKSAREKSAPIRT